MGLKKGEGDSKMVGTTFIQNGKVIGLFCEAVALQLTALGFEELEPRLFVNPTTGVTSLIELGANGFWSTPLHDDGLLALSPTALLAILDEMEIVAPKSASTLVVADLVRKQIAPNMVPVLLAQWL